MSPGGYESDATAAGLGPGSTEQRGPYLLPRGGGGSSSSLATAPHTRHGSEVSLVALGHGFL